jgi:GT2 family glycosyltransferase
MKGSAKVRFPWCENPSVSIIIVATGRAPHLLDCLESVESNTRSTAYDVRVVLNGTDEHVSSEMANTVTGAHISTSRVNRGFAGGCNLGATTATGDYLVLLNDDTLVEPGWLEALVSAAERRPRAGAVGSRLLHGDGSLQEAGQVLWSDGSTTCVGRDAPAETHAYEWARRVDYCSGSSLLVRRSTWEALGGLDEGYFPAYYEDVDLCLRITETGQEVWYEPTSRVRHLESRSSSSFYKSFLINRNRPRFVERWKEVLAKRPLPQPNSAVAIAQAVDQAMGHPTRLLLIDDRIPAPGLGAGFPRMYDFALELATSGVHVALLPTDVTDGDVTPLARAGVEIVHQRPAVHLSELATPYDVVVISRPNNYVDCAAVVREVLPAAPIVYDAEALFYRRLEKQLDLLTDPLERARGAAAAEDMKTQEMKILSDADLIVCLSDEEADIARQVAGTGRVITKIPLLAGVEPTTATFEARNDIVLVASWIAGPASPNVDGLRWFADVVFPLVQARLPWARLRVTGGPPPEPLRRLTGFGVSFEGHVPDLGAFYEAARCVIVPLRFGSGVKIKTIEALQFAVPIVATSTGAQGIDLHETGAIAIHDDPQGFSDAVIALLLDGQHWQDRRSRVERLHEIWSEVGAERPTWNEIVARAQDRPVTALRPSAHAG